MSFSRHTDSVRYSAVTIDIPNPPSFVDTPIDTPIERLSKSAPESPVAQNGGGEEDTTVYPGPAKTALIMISLYISIFLVALDRTILGPAIPEITNKFHSLDDVGWYGSAYMLTSCGFILLYGRIYTFFSTKKVFLIGIVIFEAGSAICGAAPSSLVLIIGRAIAGFGSAGIFTGAILIMLNSVPLHRRPMLQGLFGACFGLASIAGPLLGGAFTGSRATWRWCFYINLPLGGITLIVCTLFVHLDENKPRLTWKETFFKLDPLGTILFLPSITCLLLALQWGGIDYAWSEGRMIALLVVFAVLFVAFVALQYFTRNTTATVPARILLQRSVACGGLSQFCVGSTMLTVSQYIPLWFQAIKNASAMKSGIDTIPLVLSVVVGSISSGGLTQRIGYYVPFMIAGACLMAVGAGLITTWNMDTASSAWIGFQVILGLGVGNTMQHPNLAVQVVLPKKDIPSGTAILSFCQTLGGAIFVAVGQNTFLAKFIEGLGQIKGVVDPAKVVSAGATELKNHVPAQALPQVLRAYNYALVHGPFFAAMIVACLSLPAALGMEWRSVKQNMPPKPPVQQKRPKDEESSIFNSTTRLVTSRNASMLTLPTYAMRPHEKAPVWKKPYFLAEHYMILLVRAMNPDLRHL